MNSENSSGSKKKKIAASAIAVALAAALVIGGTFSYFSDSTEELVNVMNANTNGVTITETENDYEIIPGTSQTKDPTVTASATLDSYVYLVVEDNTDGLVGYEIDTDVWTLLYEADDEDNFTGGTVYYALLPMTVTTTDGDGNEVTTNYSVREVSYNVLKDKVISYSASLTNEDMWEATTTTSTETYEDGNETTSTTTTYSLKEGITLSFTAYIIQQTPFEVYETDDDGNETIEVNKAASAKKAFYYAYYDINTESELTLVTDADSLNSAIDDEAEYIVLAADVEASEVLYFNYGDATLDLNGNTLTLYTTTSAALRVESSVSYSESGASTLTITDSSTDESGVITSSSNSGVIYIGNYGAVILESGTISGNSNSEGVKISYSTSSFTMNGGTISGNNGGVYVKGTFVMNEGTISGNSTSSGGGVSIASGGAFTMNGGTISGNTGTSVYGGVYVNNGTFTMNNGTISNNTATNNGGGVGVNSSGTFIMNAGTISANTATNGKGGGVYVNGGVFTMSGGTISNNTAKTCGGVYVKSGTVTLVSASITNNTASSSSNVDISGTFTEYSTSTDDDE